VLAYLLAADRFPSDKLWDEQLVSSRLLECEIWNRINANRLRSSHGEAVRDLIGRFAIIEIVGPVLARALQPFPIAVRTLDAIHLAALEFIRTQKQDVQLASFDDRLVAAARLLGIAEWTALSVFFRDESVLLRPILVAVASDPGAPRQIKLGKSYLVSSGPRCRVPGFGTGLLLIWNPWRALGGREASVQETAA
jgi:PIN domain